MKIGKKLNMGSVRRVPSPNHYNMRAAADSGMVTHYRPAEHVKNPTFLAKIQDIWNNFFGMIRPTRTSQQGSAVASPSAYVFELYSLRYERRNTIADCRQMYDDDLRVRKSIQMYVREAVRQGVMITVDMPGRGIVGQRAKRIQQIFNEIERIVNNKDEGTPKIESWGCMAMVEGDLFIQIVVDDAEHPSKVCDAVRLPAAAMERNTDDTDQFIDPLCAFSNVDVMTNTEIATFPEVLIWHGRWCHIDGDKYGNPEMLAARRDRRLLQMEEESIVRQRVSRASQHRLWNIGTSDKPGEPTAVDEWKEQNGMVTGLVEQYDPVNVGLDFFGNGLVSCDVLEGDANVEKIDDVKYWQNQFTAACPTPGPLYNLASTDVNRDVLEDMRKQWLLSTYTLNDFLRGAIKRIIELYLMLEGIAPETVNYIIHFSESTAETPSEIVTRVKELFNNGVGTGKSFVWKPLITWKRAIQKIADFMDINDAEAEYMLIQEMVESANTEADKGAALQRMQTQGANIQRVQNNGKAPSNGKAQSASKDDTFGLRQDNFYGIPKAVPDPGSGPFNQNMKTVSGAVTGIGSTTSPWYSSYGESQNNDLDDSRFYVGAE